MTVDRKQERRSGLFLTLEGIEGAGKTTQVEMLGAAIRQSGRECVTTFEPGGGGEIGSRMRELLKNPEVWSQLELAEIYLYAADRAHHLETLILPALARDACVICDRFVDSTRAYQGFGRGRDRELIERLHELPPLDRPPDRTFLLDLSPVEGLARAQRRREERNIEHAGYDDADVLFFERVRLGFLTLAEQDPARVRVIDGEVDVETIHARIVEQLTDLIPGLAPVALSS